MSRFHEQPVQCLLLDVKGLLLRLPGQPPCRTRSVARLSVSTRLHRLPAGAWCVGMLPLSPSITAAGVQHACPPSDFARMKSARGRLDRALLMVPVASPTR